MDNDKTPGNDGIRKQFYVKCSDSLKEPFFASTRQSFLVGELNISQKQAIIKVIEKQDRDKRLIKNWRPISLLKVDVKLISKATACCLKNVISTRVNQYKMFLRLLILQILKVFLMIADIEKAFDSINHFLIMCFKKWIWK